jgi:hypothetical protein
MNLSFLGLVAALLFSGASFFGAKAHGNGYEVYGGDKGFRADKVRTVQRIDIQRYGITDIELYGLDNKFDVVSARLSDGTALYPLPEFQGRVRQGDRFFVRINPRSYVDSIEIETVSPLIGSRGTFQVVAYFNGRHNPPPRPGPRPSPRPRIQ